jgi:hypothetical protein
MEGKKKLDRMFWKKLPSLIYFKFVPVLNKVPYHKAECTNNYQINNLFQCATSTSTDSHYLTTVTHNFKQLHHSEFVIFNIQKNVSYKGLGVYDISPRL